MFVSLSTLHAFVPYNDLQQDFNKESLIYTVYFHQQVQCMTSVNGLIIMVRQRQR